LSGFRRRSSSRLLLSKALHDDGGKPKALHDDGGKPKVFHDDGSKLKALHDDEGTRKALQQREATGLPLTYKFRKPLQQQGTETPH
jgi:hypothetical protein